MGQFAWTGFDYLGEPLPYDTDAWPNHSSMVFEAKGDGLKTGRIEIKAE
ncbi:MAG: hypothetical protein LBS25_04095 [Candidatus Symbiothrix sp.]|nr:hypothetical protein [Candidatus Symbiothrix sp.]